MLTQMYDPRHFDRVADDYDAARPGYPEPLVDEVLAEAGDVQDVLEFGCGSGQLTRSLAARGLRVHAVDLGPALLAHARRRLAGYDGVEFEQADLHEWSPPRRFDMVTAGSALHWLDASHTLRLAADALHPGGTLAVLRHDHPTPLTGFHQRVQSLYREVYPYGRDLERQPSDEERIAAVAELFAVEPRLGPVRVLTHRWQRSYSRDAYLRLLRTYSEQGALPPERWQRLSEGVSAIIDQEYGGVVERPYLTVAWIAQRR